MPWAGYDESRVAGINPFVAQGYGSFENVNAKVDALMQLRFADAEQAKQTGGMVALYPRIDDALQMQLPGGEPVEELHLTMAYMGEDVSDMDPGNLSLALSQIADSYTPEDARVMGHATFNPDGGAEGEQDPCAVYIISDAPNLTEIHLAILGVCEENLQLPPQHSPWIPHVTVGYGLDANRLTFTGPITFDRIGLRWGGQSRDFPFIGG